MDRTITTLGLFSVPWLLKETLGLLNLLPRPGSRSTAMVVAILLCSAGLAWLDFVRTFDSSFSQNGPPSRYILQHSGQKIVEGSEEYKTNHYKSLLLSA